MDVWDLVAMEARQFPQDVRDLPVCPEIDLEYLRTILDTKFSFGREIPLEELTADVVSMLRSWTLHSTHPRYFGLFNPSVLSAGVVAESLAAIFNPQLAKWSSAPIANELERLTLRWCARKLGLDPDSSVAHFTSGGSEANLSGVLAALAFLLPDCLENGVGVGAGIARPALYVSSETHQSFVKIARITGLGTAAIRKCLCSADLTLNPETLRQRIVEDIDDGWKPLIIIGTAGTTGAGVIDPLGELAGLAKSFGTWFHVDGAWGASAILSQRLAPALAGIEQADSVTWDAHKWLSVPVGAGMFFCRHSEAVQRAFDVSSSYMPAEQGSSYVDPFATTFQWSRRAIGLKVFMVLAEHGESGMARMIDQQAQLADHLRLRLVECGWRIVNATVLPVICFSHEDIRSGATSASEIANVLQQRGKVWISEVVLGTGESVLRACITSIHSTADDLECLISELEYARQHAGSEGP